jgi:hypothetical protein
MPFKKKKQTNILNPNDMGKTLKIDRQSNLKKQITEDKFNNMRFKRSMQINYTPPYNSDICIECMLLAIDFDEGLFKLIPFPNDDYRELEFWVRYDHCTIPVQSSMKIDNINK